MAAGTGGTLADPWDFGNTTDIIKTIPQDLFAELCEQIIRYLQCQIPAVNTIELCQRFQAAGINIAASDVAKVVNAISFVFSTAAKCELSSEELSTKLSSAAGGLPKQAIQVIRHVWNEQGRSLTAAEDAKHMVAVGQLIDFQWKLGMAVSSGNCKSLKSPYVTIAMKVADASGHITSKTFEMTVSQFQNFYSQFKEMASILETV
uniref:COMM domain-containing protein 6 n=1 Tax=Anolis carolinensis TaxID=28377 RepID=G1KA41_ANOCA|nr:PREDICTED: COMM domain-containing protein 6 isoform X1 [Anolis carolinensis]|eukprot:XP_003218706.1 PREDICTED: COMM domain-containing protein 6 isoform X1 [Anolis carolinensis]